MERNGSKGLDRSVMALIGLAVKRQAALARIGRVRIGTAMKEYGKAATEQTRRSEDRIG